MRIAVMGAGGVGGYFGAQARAGGPRRRVRRARRASCRDARARPRASKARIGDAHCRAPTATDDPATLAPGRRRDVLRQAVGHRDARRGDRAARRRGRRRHPVPERRRKHRAIVRASSARRTCWAASPTSRRRSREPGVIAHTGTMARLRFGAFVAGASGRAREAFVDGVQGRRHRRRASSPDIRRALWEKFVFLCGVVGLTCVARQPIGVIRADPDLRATFEAAMRESVDGRPRAAASRSPTISSRSRWRSLDALPAEMKLVDAERPRRRQSPRSAVALRRGRAHGARTLASRRPSTRRSTPRSSPTRRRAR